MIFTICGGLFVFLVCLDMGIKQYVEDHMSEEDEKKTVIPNVVMRKVYNEGFAFHILDKKPELIKKVTAGAGIVLLLYDFWVFSGKKKKVRKLGMTFVTAGAVSNIYDRLARGKVIDYVGYKDEKKRSVFSEITANLADFYLVFGSILVDVSRTFSKIKKDIKKKKEIAARVKAAEKIVKESKI